MATQIDQISREIRAALLQRLGEKVDLIFHFGSRLKGTTHRYSDLDLCYVPAGPDIWDSITVMVGGVLFDLFPLPWPKLEAMAEMGDPSASVLLHNEVVYARTEQARERFAGLTARLRSLQAPEARPKMVRKALDLFRQTGYPFYLLQTQADAGHLPSCLYHAQAILQAVLHLLGVANQQCVDTRKLEQVLTLPRLPVGLEPIVRRLNEAYTPAEVLSACRSLMDATRALLLDLQREVLVGPSNLPGACAAMYPEMKADLQKILVGCERGDVGMIRRSLTSVYHELSIHLARGQTGVEYGDFNALADYEQDLSACGFPAMLPSLAACDFASLARDCLRFDEHLRAFLVQRGVSLYDFADLDDLRQHLAAGRT